MEASCQPDRAQLDVDIACVGFGPASGGFLTTLSSAMAAAGEDSAFQSRVMPGMPLQVVCYERADDFGFGVSGAVTRARAIRQSFSDEDIQSIPLATETRSEKLVYLRDPIGASRRPASVGCLETMLRFLGPSSAHAVELPHIPEFLSKEDGLVMSLGQFNQWVASRLMADAQVQLWPGTPVAKPLIEDAGVTGVQLADQGTDRVGAPEAGFMPGMNIGAQLTVVADGPIGPVGRQLDDHFGFPEGHHQREWAVGMKMVVELPPDSALEPGTVLHTMGFPEPEIFGFLYAYPDRLASIGIFVPAWLESPVRASYRYLQHWMTHPYLWRLLKGGQLRSWGAKSIQESGRRGEPFLVGDGYARIGEGSGSTNVLSGSGVDEAWATGVQLAEGVIELLRAGAPFTAATLDDAYVSRRRSSWVEKDARIAEHARDGFHRGFVTGLVGMGLTGITRGRLNVPAHVPIPRERIPSLTDYFRDRIPEDEITAIKQRVASDGTALHDALMTRSGWPEIVHDGQLLVSQQDALLMGGKVQASPGYADHVVMVDPDLCRSCDARLCVSVCSGQALTETETGIPDFDREKCVHCGACVWSCTRSHPENPERTNVEFRAGVGGLHSVEN